MEIDCITCGGSGQQSLPTPAMDQHDEPTIIHIISTCQTCSGNGKVYML